MSERHRHRRRRSRSEPEIGTDAEAPDDAGAPAEAPTDAEAGTEIDADPAEPGADSDDTDWEILVAVFEEEPGAQAAVEALGETFIANASKARRRISNARSEDAVILVVDEGGQLAASDAAVLAHKAVTGAIGGIVTRMTLGLTLGGMINTVLTSHAYAGSRRRSKQHHDTSSHPTLAEGIGRLDVGNALLVARCTDEELAGAADDLADAEAYAIWHAPEHDVVSALEADQATT